MNLFRSLWLWLPRVWSCHTPSVSAGMLLSSQVVWNSLHCLPEEKETESWVLWFAVKKVSYQPVKVFCWPKEIRCWSFPKPKFLPKRKMTSNVFINCWVTHCQPLPSSFSSESLSCFCQIKLPSFHMCHSTFSASIVPQVTTFFLPFLSWPTVTVLLNSAQI